MSAKLIAEEGILKGLVLYLDSGNEWTIGRDPDNCEFLVEDPDAAKVHARCFVTSEGIAIENLSQTHPTEVNGEPIATACLLHASDTVKVGNSLFRFYLSDVPPPINIEPESQSKVIQQEQPMEPRPEMSQPSTIIGDASESSVAAQKNPLEEDDIFPAEEHAKEEEKNSAEESKNYQDQESMLPEHHEIDIFEDHQRESKDMLAEINFDLLETGRWLLKVVGGPNTGAEFSMQASTSYLIGTDPNTCDIVFHDTSVSRQHARITVSDEDTLVLEDLKSRNGTLLDGKRVEGRNVLIPNALISVGTTSFIVFDREGEMQTIISPLLPSIVKALQQDESKEEKKGEAPSPLSPFPDAVAKELEEKPVRKSTILGAFVLVAIVTGLFTIVGMGTLALFRSEPVAIEEPVNVSSALDEALKPFPDVTRSYTPSTGRLLISGHVLTATDNSQLHYNLQGLPFIKDIDDKGIFIDEFTTREINNLLSRNKAYRGVTVTTPEPGRFVLSGYLQTNDQADRLNEYISVNFPNLTSLERRIIIEEDVINNVENMLQKAGIRNIKVKISNNVLSLNGGIPSGKEPDYNRIIEQAKAIPGIRDVRSYVNELPPEATLVNISDKYKVSGASNQGGVNLSVVINGRIVSRGDNLDGMTITSIKPNVIFLEKDGIKYRIDY